MTVQRSAHLMLSVQASPWRNVLNFSMAKPEPLVPGVVTCSAKSHMHCQPVHYCRCKEMADLYNELTGVSILNVEAGLVRLRINTILNITHSLGASAAGEATSLAPVE